MDKDEFLESMIQDTLASAQANKRLIGLDPLDSEIAQLMMRNEVVTAVWFYPEGDNVRIGAIPVKGFDGDPTDGYVICTTIPCTDEAAAQKLVELYGSVEARSKGVH